MYSGGGRTSAFRSLLWTIRSYTGPLTLSSFNVRKDHTPYTAKPTPNTLIITMKRARIFIRCKIMTSASLDDSILQA